MTRPKSYI